MNRIYTIISKHGDQKIMHEETKQRALIRAKTNSANRFDSVTITSVFNGTWEYELTPLPKENGTGAIAKCIFQEEPSPILRTEYFNMYPNGWLIAGIGQRKSLKYLAKEAKKAKKPFWEYLNDTIIQTLYASGIDYSEDTGSEYSEAKQLGGTNAPAFFFGFYEEDQEAETHATYESVYVYLDYCIHAWQEMLLEHGCVKFDLLE